MKVRIIADTCQRIIWPLKQPMMLRSRVEKNSFMRRGKYHDSADCVVQYEVSTIRSLLACIPARCVPRPKRLRQRNYGVFGLPDLFGVSRHLPRLRGTRSEEHTSEL